MSGVLRSIGPRGRWVAFAAAILALVVAVVLGRVILAARAAYDRGSSLEEVGDADGAALAYRDAIAWYYPGSPQATAAIERLWSLADAAEAAGDPIGARIIVADLRSALFSTRTLYQPHAVELALCNERLALLLAATDERVRGGVLSAESVLPRYREAVGRDHAPSVAWSLALGFGFLVWIASTLLAIAQLVPHDAGALQWRRAAPWLGVSFTSLVLWLAGVTFA